PLNNLLLRVHEAYKGVETDAPSIIRLLRAILPDWTEEAKHIRAFLPGETARRLLDNVRWKPSEDSRLSHEDLELWRSFSLAQRRSVTQSLETRIVNSANLVFVTANDRSLADLPLDRTFDLLIFEEAARAYPLEILGAMRNARRWLL